MEISVTGVNDDGSKTPLNAIKTGAGDVAKPEAVDKISFPKVSNFYLGIEPYWRDFQGAKLLCSKVNGVQKCQPLEDDQTEVTFKRKADDEVVHTVYGSQILLK